MAKLYIVRSKTYRKDVLAIVFANDVSDLFWIIDEQVDPYGTEYAHLTNAGGFGLFWLMNSSGFASHWLYDKYADEDESTASDRTDAEEAQDYAALPVGPPFLSAIGGEFLRRFLTLKWKEFTREDSLY